jgi:tRNA threonylcarbamoyl adenosine modification protein YeaZ
MTVASKGPATLAIDTSGQALYAALCDASGNVHALAERRAYSHDESLATFVVQLLSDAGCDPEEVGTLVIGKGPGSFTGLRIGWGFAYGWALTQPVELQVLCSYQAIAAVVAQESAYSSGGAAQGRVLLVLDDAGRGEYYCAAYQLLGTATPITLFEPVLLSLDEIETRLSSGLAATLPLEVVSRRELSLHGRLAEAAPNAEPQVAAGLIALSARTTSDRTVATPEALALLRPNYLRQVAAKTILEREQARIGG